MASGDSVQLIKDRLNIIDVISPHVELHKAGRHFKGRCPFHQEKSPSFHISPERGTYHCFGCGVGGDIFSFTQAIDGVDFKEALKILAMKAGVELVPENPQKRTEREQLYAVLEAATKYFENKLTGTPDAQAYLTRRGVEAETIIKWRIGYAPGPPTAGWRELREHLAVQGYTDAVMLKAGLIKNAESGKEPFDVFRDRIMFPLRDQNGKVVAFSGRILAKDSEAPKYVNSPETELYHKSELLYGYDIAKHGIRSLPFWLIVEGQFDVVMSHQAGYTNTVAVSGTALTMHHVQILERLATKVVLALDADKAGMNAMKRGAELMLRRGMDVKVATMPDGADPADLVVKDVKLFKQAVGKATHIIEYLLAHLAGTVSDERARKLRVRDEVIPFVPLIPNRIDQEHFEGVIASALESSKDAVHFEVTRLQENKKPVTHEVKLTGTVSAAATISTTQVRGEVVILQTIAVHDVVEPEVAAVMSRVFSEVLGETMEEARQKLEPGQLSKTIFQFEQTYEKMTKRGRLEEITHMLNQLRQQVSRDRLTAARNELGNGGEVDAGVLERVLVLQKMLQAPPYTLDIFTL